jgi:hypothetical protein
MIARRRTAPRSSSPWEQYVESTHRPINSLAIVLPLLVFFHIGAAYWGIRFIPHRDLRRLLAFFGATAPFLPAMMVITVLVAQHLARKDRWAVQGRVVGGMLIEAVIWTLPLVAVSFLRRVHAGQAVASALSNRPLGQQLVFFVGAGVYEEFIFRLVGIGLLVLVFHDVFKLPEPPVIIAAIAATALLFALYHFTGRQLAGGQLAWGRLLFLTMAGALWGTAQVLRGFGVAVASHITWNLYVALS